jgi:hypothetical protein
VDENVKLGAELRPTATERFVRLAAVIARAARAIRESRKSIEQARALLKQRRPRLRVPPKDLL